MKRLVILMPTMGRVHTQFMTTMIGLTQALKDRKIPFALKHYEFSDLIMSRNYLVSYFLSQSQFTHALLLDSDLAFKPEQFFRLWDFDVDFAAAAYADRRITGTVLKNAMQSATAADLEDPDAVSKLLARYMKYIATTNMGTGTAFQSVRRGDFMTVASAATGFMLISRNVVEGMVANGQAAPLKRTGKLGIYSDAPRFADFFSHHKTAEGDAFYGEDQSFCRRWILGCGGDVWLDRA
ncbi:MAG: hypothetical protein AAF701_02760, partial [Pseudomonadota bacterium]